MTEYDNTKKACVKIDAGFQMLVCFSLRLLAEGSKTGDVLADYVEFDIDLRADAEAAEVGMLVCVGDDGHAEAARTAVADRKTDAVDP